MGDAALRATAKILAAQVRHTDLVARFGGEEFVVLLVETDAAAALRVCEKLRTAVAQSQLGGDSPGAVAHHIDRRVGRHDRPAHDRMLALADRNLYTAKAAGRNRVVG